MQSAASIGVYPHQKISGIYFRWEKTDSMIGVKHFLKILEKSGMEEQLQALQSFLKESDDITLEKEDSKM